MTDNEFLLKHLADGLWHSHSEILEASLRSRGCGLTIHSRAADLRKHGHQIDVQMRGNGRGRNVSFYRLFVALDEASPIHGPSEVSSSAPSNPACPDDDAPIHVAPRRDGDALTLVVTLNEPAADSASRPSSLSVPATLTPSSAEGSETPAAASGTLLLFNEHDQARTGPRSTYWEPDAA